MGTELVNTEAFKGGPSKAFASLPQDEHLSDGIGSSYGVINYKGKVWSLRHRGEKKTFVRPDDGTPISYLDVVILQEAKVKSKSLFKAFDPAGTSEGERPLCSSINSVMPDTDAAVPNGDPNPHAPIPCGICPKNEWKIGANGKKGRDCQDYKRLAVLLLPTQTKQLLGEPLIEPVFLRVPPASLNNLALMGEQMDAQGYHFSSYVTRITFDPAESHPKMVFRALQPLGDMEAPVVLPLRNDPLCARIIGLSDEIKAITHSQPAEKVTPLPTGPVQPTVSVQQPVKPAEPVKTLELHAINTGFVAAPTRGVPDTNASAPYQQSTGTDVIPETPAPTTAAKPVAEANPADTGEPKMADLDLDARIAALMLKPQ